jgi:hypothetical protein
VLVTRMAWRRFNAPAHGLGNAAHRPPHRFLTAVSEAGGSHGTRCQGRPGVELAG